VAIKDGMSPKVAATKVLMERIIGGGLVEDVHKRCGDKVSPGQLGEILKQYRAQAMKILSTLGTESKNSLLADSARLALDSLIVREARSAGATMNTMF
jgi:hypothetical protein